MNADLMPPDAALEFRSPMAAKKKFSPAYTVAHDVLTKNPDASFADVKKVADRKGITLHGVTYGRVKLALGLVGAKPGAKRLPEAASAEKDAPPPPQRKRRQRPGRKPMSEDARSRIAGLEDIVRTVRESEKETTQLRTTLTRIRDLIDDALES